MLGLFPTLKLENAKYLGKCQYTDFGTLTLFGLLFFQKCHKYNELFTYLLLPCASCKYHV